MSKLGHLKYDDANYQLRMGMASENDAHDYCAVWNRTKFSTRAIVVIKTEKVQGVLLKVPRIVITDTEQ